MAGMSATPRNDSSVVQATTLPDNPLARLIADEIGQRGGFMRFERYMELALYTPGLGYYSGGRTVLGQGLENLAQGNLTHRIEQPFPDALDRLRQYFNTAADSLTDTINTVKRGSFGIKSGTEEIAQASDNLSRRTENQAANLEETAATTEQLAASVKHSAGRSRVA
mgnify:CR=1 FL=1